MFNIGTDVLRFGIRQNTEQKLFLTKIKLVRFVFACIFIFFIFRTFQLGFIGLHKKHFDLNNLNWQPTRADIVDRNGEILAKNIISGHIILRPRFVKDKNAVASVVHEILPYDYSVRKVLQIIDSKKRFVYLKKFVNYDILSILKDKKINKNIDLSGLEIEITEKRFYPKHRLFSHILGFVGDDKIGLEGIERIYDSYLINNKDSLKLSLDSRIQSIIYQELDQAFNDYSVKSAMGILMNSRTGEILSIVSKPDYNPNDLNSNPAINRINSPLKNVYELGSIFKLFNTAMAVENGINKIYDVSKPFEIKNTNGEIIKKISDAYRMPKEKMSVGEIFLYSCNVGSAQIALDLPSGTQEEFFKRINLTQSLSLDFGQTTKPIVQSLGILERATVSFGHGIAVTPIHLLLAVNSMINGGIYINPTILKRGIGKIDGKRVISENISLYLRELMKRVTDETSGKHVQIKGINIGSKTGTAEKVINGKIDKKKNITSFVTVFPIESPQYIMLIILDEPQGNEKNFGLRTAAWNVVPVSKKILESILPLLF